jgi:hypothetical protein
MIFTKSRVPEISHSQELDTINRKPVPVQLLPIDPPSEYLKLCEELDFNPIDLRIMRFERLCFEHEIPIYDLTQVKDYLQRQAQKINMTMRFVPLSTRDGTYDYAGHGSSRPYPHIIPLRILQTVKLIKENFPDSRFFVSKIEKFPDPFIGVDLDTKNTRLIIFGVWDEPGFSG